MRHRLFPSFGRRSKANSRSGAGMRPTRMSSRTSGRPPSSSPERWSSDSLRRREPAGMRHDAEMSMILSLFTRGVMSARSEVKMGLVLLLRKG